MDERTYNRSDFLHTLASFAGPPDPADLARGLAEELLAWRRMLALNERDSAATDFTVDSHNAQVTLTLRAKRRGPFEPAFTRTRTFSFIVPGESWNRAMTAASEIFRKALELSREFNGDVNRVVDGLNEFTHRQS